MLISETPMPYLLLASKVCDQRVYACAAVNCEVPVFNAACSYTKNWNEVRIAEAIEADTVALLVRQ